MDITLVDETQQVTEQQITEIDTLLQFAGEYLNIQKDAEMSVTFMNNEAIQEINRAYREKDQPTDVISFAIEEESPEELTITFDTMDMPFPRNLGDIMISVDKAHEQAIEYGHSFERELGFLAVHGFLHLNGYDHMTPEDETLMFGLQREILGAYGLER